MYRTEERINEMEDRIIQITQSEKRVEKNNKESPRNLGIIN